MVTSVKGKVACSPFPDMSVKTSLRGTGTTRVAQIENKATLSPLAVILATEDGRFSPGDIVYVHSKQYTMPWAKEVLCVDGFSFILVPDNFIEAFSPHKGSSVSSTGMPTWEIEANKANEIFR
jgi:hypothetical protein